jgi:hypothetical protein
MTTEARGLVHTYYVPAQRRAFGEAATELAPVLRAIWAEVAPSNDVDFFDGTSAWLDPDGEPHLAIVRDRAVELSTRADWLDAIARVLRPYAAKAASAAYKPVEQPAEP